MPGTVKAGAPLAVTNLVSVGEDVLVYAVEEIVSPGWSVGKISTAGFVDIIHGKIKWGPFFDHEQRVLSYELIAPENARGDFTLTGTASFNGETMPIVGQARLRVEPAQGSGARDEVISQLPESFVPGGTLLLTNKVTLSEETIVYAVEDQVPAGWSVGLINQGGTLDAATRKVKWGPFSDRVARELICEFKPPSGFTNSVTLIGVAWFDGRPVLIGGQRQTRPVVGTVVSQLPTQYEAGQQITVRLTVTPTPLTKVFAVEDRPPSGWSISQISDGGENDPRVGRIKWGPFFTNGVTILTYQVTAPDAIRDAIVTFSGIGSFDELSTTVLGQREMTAVVSKVTRLVTPEFLTGAPFTITNLAAPDRTVTVYAVEDEVPAGVAVSGISHEGSYDGVTRRIKWGPFLDQEPRALQYTVTPPSTFTGAMSFRGTGAFNGLQVSIAGQQETRAVSVSERNKVSRSLPASVRAARSIWVTNQVSVGTSLTLYAVEDQVPTEWTASEISHQGLFDPQSSKVKWGPFFDATERALTYQLAAPTNAGGRVTIQGTASFNAELVPVGGSSNLLAIANHRPVAREDAFPRLPGQPLTLSVTNLLANDSDPDNDPLTVLELTATSAGRGTVRLVEGVITYTPPPGADQPDTFTYTISDGFGGAATGLVRISVVTPGPGLNRWRVETFPDGTIRLRFAGIPGRTYLVQATTSLQSPTWVTLDTRVAGLQGDFEFHDTDALNHPTRFYRSLAP